MSINASAADDLEGWNLVTKGRRSRRSPKKPSEDPSAEEFPALAPTHVGEWGDDENPIETPAKPAETEPAKTEKKPAEVELAETEKKPAEIETPTYKFGDFGNSDDEADKKPPATLVALFESAAASATPAAPPAPAASAAPPAPAASAAPPAPAASAAPPAPAASAVPPAPAASAVPPAPAASAAPPALAGAGGAAPPVGVGAPATAYPYPQQWGAAPWYSPHPPFAPSGAKYRQILSLAGPVGPVVRALCRSKKNEQGLPVTVSFDNSATVSLEISNGRAIRLVLGHKEACHHGRFLKDDVCTTCGSRNEGTSCACMFDMIGRCANEACPGAHAANTCWGATALMMMAVFHVNSKIARGEETGAAAREMWKAARAAAEKVHLGMEYCNCMCENGTKLAIPDFLEDTGYPVKANPGYIYGTGAVDTLREHYGEEGWMTLCEKVKELI